MTEIVKSADADCNEAIEQLREVARTLKAVGDDRVDLDGQVRGLQEELSVANDDSEALSEVKVLVADLRRGLITHEGARLVMCAACAWLAKIGQNWHLAAPQSPKSSVDVHGGVS